MLCIKAVKDLRDPMKLTSFENSTTPRKRLCSKFLASLFPLRTLKTWCPLRCATANFLHMWSEYHAFRETASSDALVSKWIERFSKYDATSKTTWKCRENSVIFPCMDVATPFPRHFRVVLDVASCLLNLSNVVSMHRRIAFSNLLGKMCYGMRVECCFRRII